MMSKKTDEEKEKIEDEVTNKVMDNLESLTCIECGEPLQINDGTTDVPIGVLWFDEGTHDTRMEPGEPSEAYWVCGKCFKEKFIRNSEVKQ